MSYSSWIADENIFEYNENKERYTLSSRLPRGFKEALVQIEEAYQKQPQRVNSFVLLLYLN